MFWNDPILYGATFPYKDIPNPVQTPFIGAGFTPWQNLPRFVPNFYGFQQPHLNDPFYGQFHKETPPTPFMQSPWQDLPRYQLPFYGVQPNLPLHFNPYVQPFKMNLPYNYCCY